MFENDKNEGAAILIDETGRNWEAIFQKNKIGKAI